ncbi:hypothetical protein KC315_g11630 [Hortaea werneckii]|nr:hypothetical protein KC315_g11630 [Hortaea werneckii]
MPVSSISNNNVAYSNGRPSISTNASNRQRGAAQAYTGRTQTGYRYRAQQLQPRLDLVTSKKPLAVDCEGVILEEEVGASKKGHGRVSIVNSEGQAVYDTFVYYPEDVPHRPPPQRLKLGVKYNDIKPTNGAQPISDVIKNVQALFDKAEIVVMHAASNDVQMLKGITWTKLTLYDTQTLPEYCRLTSPDRPSLKFLTKMELGDEIQEGSDGHCSVEDARATMKLYLLQKSAFERDQSTLFTRPLAMRRQITSNSSLLQPNSVYEPDYLRQQAHWLRNELDPRIAQAGPDALHSDEVLRVDEFLRRLLKANISIDDLRSSRMHLAVNEIAGRSTRWPRRLIERCEALKETWESNYGPLKSIGILLYEPGGRLHGICQPEDIDRNVLFVKWLKSPSAAFSPLKAKRFGDLGFTAGDWWINPLFALYAGIIDNSDASGGIVADANGAYAVVMTAGDEVKGSSPDILVYRARTDDTGRYRLTSGTPESRHPVRILRSHSLRSFYAPKAGLRYDGLHKVSGWTVRTDPQSKQVVYEITFTRLASEPSMAQVQRRPFAEEVEDYKEYKRLRDVHRKKQISERPPKIAISGDAIYEDATAESPFQSQFTDKISEASARPERPALAAMGGGWQS